MALGEPETLPAAIEKAADVVSRGLDHVAAENSLSAADTLFSDLLGLPFALGPLPLLMGATMFLQQKIHGSSHWNKNSR